MNSPGIDALAAMGFTALEAEVYLVLAGGENATGYAIAKALRKPAANVYKAIESLHAKGAILVDESNGKRVRATAPRELLRLFGRDFEARRRRAAEALAHLPGPGKDHRIYELGSRAQVLERARTMLDGARRIALLDLGPGPLHILAADLSRTATRGVLVAVRSEATLEIPGVEVDGISPAGVSVEEPWPGDWLTLVVDGAQHLLAVFDAAGELHQGTFSDSAFLSWVYHCGLAAEITLDRLDPLLAAGDGAKLMATRALAHRLVPRDAPGRRQLLRSLTPPPTEPP
jgi:hypothetical protein